MSTVKVTELEFKLPTVSLTKTITVLEPSTAVNVVLLQLAKVELAAPFNEYLQLAALVV